MPCLINSPVKRGSSSSQMKILVSPAIVDLLSVRENTCRPNKNIILKVQDVIRGENTQGTKGTEQSQFLKKCIFDKLT
jgi:hypothetical protein